MIAAISVGIGILLLGLALWTVVVRDTFAAVAGFIPYGLLLTLAWLVLRAVDVALTEAAIGAGLTGA
ncbi:hydrogenase subunit MbhD domain-containing protein, partial [Paraburkholderia sp. BR10872]